MTVWPATDYDPSLRQPKKKEVCAGEVAYGVVCVRWAQEALSPCLPVAEKTKQGAPSGRIEMRAVNEGRRWPVAAGCC